MSGNSWVGKHKKELLAALAVGGVGALTGGFGLLGAGAEAGAGAAAGGLAGADAVGAGAGLLGAESGAGAAAGGLAGADAVGAGAGTMGPVDTFMANGGLGKVGGALDKFGKLSRVAGLLNPQQPSTPPMQMPQGAPQMAPLPTAPSMAQTYPTNIGAAPQMGPEELRRLLAMMQQRGGYG